MLNTECKQCHKKWHHDNAKYCTLCGKQLMDEPEFKVGDIVSSEILPDGIGIVRLEQYLKGEISEVYGIWYTNNDCEIQEGYFAVFKEDTRHAAPTEILEYEMALTFHKHGRKPFEVKEGDLIESKSGTKTIISYPQTFPKMNFVNGNRKLLKTAEEVDEWLGVDDDK